MKLFLILVLLLALLSFSNGTLYDLSSLTRILLSTRPEDRLEIAVVSGLVEKLKQLIGKREYQNDIQSDPDLIATIARILEAQNFV